MPPKFSQQFTPLSDHMSSYVTLQLHVDLSVYPRFLDREVVILNQWGSRQISLVNVRLL